MFVNQLKVGLNKPIHIVIFLFALIIYSCANMDMPSGGPKDILPPQIKESTPPNHSVNFNDDKILILFDEFIRLNSVNQKLIVSPPLVEKPKIINKGKILLININNELRKNTTYTFNFGDAIADIHEGNAEKNFQFVFATGNHLDSLQISGSILDAYSHEKQKDIFVCLYNDNVDSLPIKETPYYISKTDESGNFKLNYIKEGSYKIFALNDLNANYLFDLPNEQIAFLDTLITPYATITIDTNVYKIRKDSISFTDSITYDTTISYFPENLTLYLFEQDYKNQYITTIKRQSRYQVLLIFNRPLIDSVFDISLVNDKLLKDSRFIEYNKTLDTLNVWLTDSNIYDKDTLKFLVNYTVKDSTGNLISMNDTSDLIFREPVKNDDNLPLKTVLKYICNLSDGNIFDLNKKIILNFDTPIKKINRNKISLSEIQEDSSYTPVNANVTQAADHLRKIYIQPEFKSNTKYKLELLPCAVNDYYGKQNDTILINFSTRDLEYYGTLYLNIEDTINNYIIHLTDENNKVLRTFFCNENENDKITIDYLYPGNYKLNAILDKNKNKKWDTGNYLEKVFPEEVIYYNEVLNVKSNWELNINWEMDKNKKGDE